MDAVHGAGDGLPLGEHQAAPALVIDPSADTLQADGAVESAGYLRRLQLIGASLRTTGGLARNVLAMLVWQGANYLAPLLTFPHLARTLQPAGFGQYGLYLVVGGWMTIFTDWGTNFTGVRAVAQADAQTGSIDEAFWDIFVVRLAIALLLLAGTVGCLLATAADRHVWLLALSAWLIAFGNALTVSFCLQGLERLDAFATAAVIGKLLTVPATLLLVGSADAAWVAVAIQGAGGMAVGLLSLLLLLRTRRLGRIRWSWRGSATHLRDGIPVLLSTVSHGFYSSSATTVLGWSAGQAVTGVFVCADRIRLALQGLVSQLAQAVFPRVSRLAVTDRRAAVLLLRRLALVQLVGMGSLCALLALLAPEVVRLVAGPSYAASVAVLRILAPGVVLVAVNNAIGFQTLMSFHRERAVARITVAAALCNGALMLPLVALGGAEGAAWCVLVTEAILFGSFVWRGARDGLLSLDQPGVAAARG